MCGVVVLIAWGCTAAFRAVEDASSFGAEGQSVEFEFVDLPAPTPAQAPELPEGDVILASRTEYGETEITDLGTWAIPLASRETGDPVRLLDGNAHTLSPGGHYVVAYNQETERQEIIRLRDRMVVGEITAHGFIFLDDHRIVAFGSDDNFRFDEAKEIDLDGQTIHDIEAQGLTMSVSPTFVVDGEIGLCEEQELDRGSGPSCVSTRLLDPVSGETRPLPENPEPTISNDGEYLFTDAWASRLVGDEVVYWLDDDDDTNDLGRFEALRAGRRSGPAAQDRRSAAPLQLVESIFSTSDGQWAVIDSAPTGGGVGISVCDVATLDCSALRSTNRVPYTTPEWTPIGVEPESALGGD